MTEDEEIKRKVNSTSTKTNALRPYTKISFGAVQNKRFVDLLSDDSQFPLCNPGMNASKVRAKMILHSVGIGTHAYKHGGVRGG